MTRLQQQLDTLFFDADFKFNKAPTVVVVGSGVAGVSTALALHKCGAKVTILSAQESTEDTPQHLKEGTYPITSQVAGALWEYPPAVCGAHNDMDSEEDAKHWSVVSYRAFNKVIEQPELFPNAGVRMHPSAFFYHNNIKVPIPGQPQATLSKMLNIAKNPYISGFEYNGDDNKLLKKYKDVTPPFIIDAKVVDGFQHDAALIDTDLWMNFLRSLLVAADIKVIQYVVKDFYKEKEHITKLVEAAGRGTADAFIIATGLNSNYVVNDHNVYARRGAVFRFPHTAGGPCGDPLPGVAKIAHIDLLKNHAFCIPVSELNMVDNKAHASHKKENEPGEPSHFAFVVPRGDHSTIVGGFSEALSDEEAQQSFEYYKKACKMDDPYTRREIDNKYFQERVDELKRKAVAFLQPVADLIKVHEHDLHKYLFAGLRPFRVGGCRLELEEGQNIVHNYGHGGSGVSWSIGCAVEATHLVRKFLTGKAKPVDHTLRNILKTTTREYVYTPIDKHQSVGDIYEQERVNNHIHTK